MLRDGERLFYRATAWKGPISSDVGTASLSVRRSPAGSRAPGWRIVARASGSSMGRTMNSHVVSTLDLTGRKLRLFEEINRGSRRSSRRLEFGPKQLLYRKMKHCPGCDNRAHFDGRSHCNDHRCGKYGHRVWRLRHRHPADAAASDPLTAIYKARALDLRVGGPDRMLRICAGHGIFDVTVRAVRRERCTVPAGTFDALRLELIPTPAPGMPKTERFQGLFGLSGKIVIHVDTARKIPLRIRGIVPMGIDINAEVVLTRIQEPPASAKPKPSAPPSSASRQPPR
jgi:hypothetical protein